MIIIGQVYPEEIADLKSVITTSSIRKMTKNLVLKNKVMEMRTWENWID